MVPQKDAVVRKFIELLGGHRESLQNALTETQRGAREAPGSNVTHSDTSKSRLSDVALGLEKRVIEIDQAIAALSCPLSTLSKITIGALVGAGDIQTKQVTYYYIVRQGGGHTISVGQISVTSLSAGAPFCRALMGKEVGDDVEYQDKELQIESVE